MGDSDDDGDYKRRDKFRTERRGYDGPGDRGASPGPGLGRREWRDARPGPPGGPGGWGGRDRRSGGGGGGYEPNYNSRRDRYSPPPGRRHGGGGHHDMSPPNKRMRDDRYGGYEGGYNDRYDYDRGMGHRGHGGGGGHRGGGAGGGGGGGNSSVDQDGVQPLMMSFKAFLGTQDDSISDEEAIKKYAEYKLEFKRQQLNEFFVNHKDEEWFKMKYHPEDSTKRKDELKAALKRRVEIFTDFLGQNKFDGTVSIDGDQSDNLVKLLDSVVIMLEGGTEFDLQVLEKVEEEVKKEAEAEEAANKDEEVKEKDEKEEKKEDESAEAEVLSDEKKELQQKAKGYLESGAAADNPETDNKRKRKRTKEYDDDSSGSSSSDDEHEEEDLPPGMDAKKEEAPPKEEEGEKEEEKVEEEEKKEQNGEEKENGIEEDNKEEEDKKEEKVEEEENEDDGAEKPRALHKTASIFLRNLAPTITKQEVEAMCKRYPGFLRAAIADPQPERRWFRRGWVTFERQVKIKEICYSLNNIRLRDCELGPIVNRDLSRRVRTVNGITVDRKVVRNDIKLAAKVITNLDKRWNLWDAATKKEESEEEKKDVVMEQSSEDLGIVSNNPILSNITDYLIEEASAEEEELLGKNSELGDGEEGEEGNKIVRDQELVKVLDKLLFYLRIVHSVDFYNHSEYPNEDEMPNRCGIMHARGIPPSGNVTQAEMDEYCATFEKKMGSFLQPRADLSEEDAGKLGMKNEEDEVEKFVQANTQELGKDKWLCPLSGKKFKGPDFVRKHIFNKHGEKVEEVKKEVQYYNNYLKDPKRPQLPENPQNRAGPPGGHPGGQGGPRHRGDTARYQYSGMPREATNYPVYDDYREQRGYHEPRYGGGMERGYRGGGPRPRPDGYGRGRIHDRVGLPPPRPRVTQIERDPRGVIDYSDVDLNHDTEFF